MVTATAVRRQALRAGLRECFAPLPAAFASLSAATMSEAILFMPSARVGPNPVSKIPSNSGTIVPMLPFVILDGPNAPCVDFFVFLEAVRVRQILTRHTGA